MAKPKKTGPRDVLYQARYGAFQKKYWWLGGLVFVIGVVGVPVGLLANTGWEINRRPVEPWAATLMIEVFALGALLVSGYATAITWRSIKSPQRVAVTSRAIIVPQGALTNRELVLPFDEVRTSIFDVGFVKQLQIRHGRKKILLTSARFESEAEFDRLVQHLPS